MKTAKNPKSPRLIPAVTVAAALLILAVSAAVFVLAGYSRIYPNVYADGVRLGGMTAEQADEALLEHIEPRFKNSSLTVTAGDFSEIFTAENTRAVCSAGDTARAAYNIGREGGFGKRLSEAARAFFSRADVPIASGVTLDEAAVRERIASLAEKFDSPSARSSYALGKNELIVTLSRAGRTLNREKLLQSVLRAFETLDFAPQQAPFEAPEPEPFNENAVMSLVFVEPKDALPDLSDPDEPKATQHTVGVSVDMDELNAQIEAARRNGGASVTVPLIFTRPEVTREELEAKLFADELAAFTTYLSAANLPRTSNIRLASQYMDGTILLPGGEFSYNEVVGERTPERGFQEAGAYLNGKLVPETGGGICQLSSGLYNAALLANLEITQRFNHSLSVGYVPTGLDATVSWGTLDFKFRNSTPYPIRLYAKQSGNRLKVTIIGTKTDDYRVTIERVPISGTPMETLEVENPALGAGARIVVQEGHDGAVVETYRNVFDADGKLIIRKREATSTYKKADKIVECGPEPDGETASVTSLPDGDTSAFSP
ncbi:hypothetical protein FACS18949_03970 [Clostridia bacterium]|nr:hypothetical protein FACS18949_03970 [Clostridia bacterium]